MGIEIFALFATIASSGSILFLIAMIIASAMSERKDSWRLLKRSMLFGRLSLILMGEGVISLVLYYFLASV